MAYWQKRLWVATHERAKGVIKGALSGHNWARMAYWQKRLWVATHKSPLEWSLIEGT
jgi:hypothetical protein